jgi:small membrane protein
MIFKYILLGLLAAFLFYVLLLPRQSLLRKGFVLSFVALMLAFTINPEWSTALAQSVGVSRGVDLLFYLSHLVLFFIAFMYYLKFRELELRFTMLVRELALDAARTSART